jgi:Protein of unknown function (DUF2934)
MMVSKVQKQPGQNKAIASTMSPAAETAMLGVRSSQDAISERAFQLYEKRGSEHGLDLQDWLGAEHQILAR